MPPADPTPESERVHRDLRVRLGKPESISYPTRSFFDILGILISLRLAGPRAKHQTLPVGGVGRA